MNFGLNPAKASTDGLINPFKRAQQSRLTELLKNKRTAFKYLLILTMITALPFCAIIIFTKTSQITELCEEQLLYQGSIAKTRASIDNIEETIIKEEALTSHFNQLQKELTATLLQHKKTRVELISASGKSQENNVDALLRLIEDESIHHEQLIKSKIHLLNKRTERELKINETINQIAAFKGIHEQITLTNVIPYKSDLLNEANYAILSGWFSPRRTFKLKLLYKPTSLVFTPSDFHLSVKDYKNIIVLVKLHSEMIIGGYTSQDWTGNGFKSDSKAFLFNLSKKKYFPIYDTKSAIYCSQKTFPIFGDGDFTINPDDFTSDFPNSYGVTNVGRLELTNGLSETLIQRLEVFTIEDA